MFQDKRKQVIDKMAAVFILQGYLDSLPLKGDFTMTEHNHDSQLEINNEEELLTLFDEEGNEVLYRKF